MIESNSEESYLFDLLDHVDDGEFDAIGEEQALLLHEWQFV